MTQRNNLPAFLADARFHVESGSPGEIHYELYLGDISRRHVIIAVSESDAPGKWLISLNTYDPGPGGDDYLGGTEFEV